MDVIAAMERIDLVQPLINLQSNDAREGKNQVKDRKIKSVYAGEAAVPGVFTRETKSLLSTLK